MGARVDGRDSLGAPVAPAAHWPELALLIAVVSDARKDTGSTDGMARAVATSTLLRHRAAAVVPERLERTKAAFLARDFAAFAKQTGNELVSQETLGDEFVHVLKRR
jgi:diphosphomevalonate decarboxylase